MRQVGGAHRGLDLWLVQRVSAVYMALFLPVFWFCRAGTGYTGWHALFLGLPMKAAAALFVAALLLHAWIGLREILIDYVHPLAWRLPLYFLFALAYAGCLVWAVDILWKVQ